MSYQRPVAVPRINKEQLAQLKAQLEATVPGSSTAVFVPIVETEEGAVITAKEATYLELGGHGRCNPVRGLHSVTETATGWNVVLLCNEDICDCGY